MKILIKLKPYCPLVLIAWMAAVFVSSCNDIVEPSVKGKQVQLESPFDKFQSTSPDISFWWDEVDHATIYHLQVVKPDFTAPESLVLDTVITKNKFLHTLTPGKYQWRVMAQNSSSHTEYSTPHSFEVANTVGYHPSMPMNNTLIAAATKQHLLKFNAASVYKREFVVADNSAGNVVFRRPSAILTSANALSVGAQSFILIR
jgi:hypothetical protein